MAIKVCSNCNEENSEYASVCTSCSHPLHNAKHYGIPNNEKTQNALYNNKKEFCSKCSERLDEGALKCKYCGEMTISAPYKRAYGSGNPPYSYESSNGSAVVLLYIATFFIPIVGLIVGGIYALDDDPDKSSIGKGLIVFGLIMIIVGVILWSVIS